MTPAVSGALERARSLLSSPQMEDVLLQALTGGTGAAPPGFSVLLDAFHPRAGQDVSGIYRVSYGLPEPTVDYLGVTTADVPTATVLQQDDLTLRVWRHPADPRLPGLTGACTPETVSGWLAGEQVISCQTLSYRPLRRAVVRVQTHRRTAYLKVLRPRSAVRVAARQQLLATRGLAPEILAQPAPGVLVLETAGGLPLAEHLSALRPDLPTPDPQSVVALLDRLPDEVCALPANPSWSDRLDAHLRAALDSGCDRRSVTELGSKLTDLLAADSPGPVVATHGDCYEANWLQIWRTSAASGLATRTVKVIVA